MTDSDTIEDLREQVRYWKSEALGVRDAERRGRLMKVFNITMSQAEILDALYAKNGGAVSTQALNEAVTGHNGWEERSGNSTDVQLHRLRSKLPPDSIGRIWGVGRYLTPIGIAAVKNALTES